MNARDTGPSQAPALSQNPPASPPVPEAAESVSSTQQSQPPPASPPPSPTTAIAISFDVTFNSIPATSLTQSQIQQVIQDVRGAIKTYAYPAVVGVSVNGSSPAPAPSQVHIVLSSAAINIPYPLNCYPCYQCILYLLPKHTFDPPSFLFSAMHFIDPVDHLPSDIWLSICQPSQKLPGTDVFIGSKTNCSN